MHSPYLFLPIGILGLISYTFSYLLVKLDVWNVHTHRRIWNVLLLCTFLVTAILGLLLVIQINYKLEWNFVKKMLIWHVDFGIAMSFIAAFHLAWHWPYFMNLLQLKKGNVMEGKETVSNKNNIRESLPVLIMLSGFIATITQVLYIREITTVFQGNELMMTWTLGIWMLLTGTGAYIGRKERPASTSISQISGILVITCLLPVILIPLLSILKNQLFPPGILVNPISFFVLVIILLSPVCILSGLVFARLVHLIRQEKDGYIKVYSFEAVGSMIGGICVSFLMIEWFSILESFLLTAIITNFILFILEKKMLNLFLGLVSLVSIVVTLIYPVDEWNKSKLFINQKVVASKETRFGNLSITESSGQFAFYENGNLLFTSENTIVSEEHVHYAMLQHKDPKMVLLVSGGVSGMLKEILKYPNIQSVDYIEPDPGIFKLASHYLPLPEDERIRTVTGDLKHFINHEAGKYDIIIMALPDPASLSVNRLYTENFIKKIKQNLNSEGIIIYGISPSGNYISKSKIQLEASIYNSLKGNFGKVIIIPGEKDYFIASDTDLSAKISLLYQRHDIENSYVNSYYMDDGSIEQRSNYILNSISDDRSQNTDNRPLPVFLYAAQFLSQFSLQWGYILLIPLIIFLLPFFRLSATSLSVYLAGFTASSVEILLIFSFQLVFGYIYSALGILIAVFMIGLAIGAIAGKKMKILHKHLISAQLLLALYPLLYLIVWKLMVDTTNSVILWCIYLILVILPSAITGYIYVAATKSISSSVAEVAPYNYAMDLLGSALGIFLFSIFILPLTGIITGCIILVAINLLGALVNKPLRAFQS